MLQTDYFDKYFQHKFGWRWIELFDCKLFFNIGKVLWIYLHFYGFVNREMIFISTVSNPKKKKKKEKRRKWDENERHINNHWYIYIKVEGGRWRSRLNEENGELRSGHTYWSTPFPLLCLKNLLGFVLDSRKIIMFRWHFRNFGLGPTPLLMEWIFVLFYIFMEWIFALF